MTADDDRVGYCRPPKRTRWNKGVSGNPRGTHGKVAKALPELIEEVFMKVVNITENGKSRTCTVFEAILLKLWMRSMEGSARAMRILDRYKEFADQRPEYYVMTEEQERQAPELYRQFLKESDADD